MVAAAAVVAAAGGAASIPVGSVHAKHILLEFKAPWPPARQKSRRTRENAFALAEQLNDRILAGETFDALARPDLAPRVIAASRGVGSFFA